ncbi:hypothetical protein [Paracnuella aquatica]|uniref:hypothetical protein n=1 Tax=Paracnuella aquatica TaxID=2268757 RepID=UPI000F503547|nr:hypothetical protein [Paracnuella aquatica]RPD48853.1 hypothetical protein DRJ53_09315 [Paracnuella aquatica]
MNRTFIVIVLAIAASCTYLFTLAQSSVSKATAQASKKYSYAVLYFHDQWDRIGNPKNMWVNSDHVNDALKAKIKNFKYTDDALNALGADGWQLISAFSTGTDPGTEYSYYLMKPAN